MEASRLRERGPLGQGDGPRDHEEKNQTGGGHGTEGPWWKRRGEEGGGVTGTGEGNYKL